MARWLLLLTNLLSLPLLPEAQGLAYPENYFRNPLDIPMELEANLGELRPNHWHMGLDIRTNQQQNLPVHAAAEGYIAAIGIRPESFGRFIIIRHPNGFSTLYAHLNDFFPALEQFVTALQYKQERWAIELQFSPQQFPVSKGQFIAFSGNTGGSEGPHLHFEIFNTRTEKRLNPLFFGLPLSDDTPPVISKLALYDRDKSVFVQAPEIFSLSKSGSGYELKKNTVIKTVLDKVSFAIEASDKMKAGGSEDGIYADKLFVDGKLQFAMAIDSLDYDETLYINAATDHVFRMNGGAWLQHLSRLPGNHCSIYRSSPGAGVMYLNDTIIHHLEIEVKDAFNHTVTLSFYIQHQGSQDPRPLTGNQTLFIPNQKNELKKNGFEAYLPADALYDTVPVQFSAIHNWETNAVSPGYQVNDASIPIHAHMLIKIKPDREIPDTLKNKIVIQRSSHGTSVKKAEWQGEWLVTRMGEFGTFTAYTDNIPPRISELNGDHKNNDTVILSADRIILLPTDNFDVIDSFRAELDGNWLRFTNDKGKYFVYTFDERCPYGIHHLKVRVEDLAGNASSREWWFKRVPYVPPPKKKKTHHKKGITKSKSKNRR